MMNALHMLWEVILCSEDVSTVGDIVSSLAGRSHDAPHSSGTILQDLAHNAAKIGYLLCTFLVCQLNANIVLKFQLSAASMNCSSLKKGRCWAFRAVPLFLHYQIQPSGRASPYPQPSLLLLGHDHYAAEIHLLQGRRQVCLHKGNF